MLDIFQTVRVLSVTLGLVLSWAKYGAKHIYIYLFKVEGIRASCQMCWAWSWPPGLTDICFKYLRSSTEFCQLFTLRLRGEG